MMNLDAFDAGRLQASLCRLGKRFGSFQSVDLTAKPGERGRRVSGRSANVERAIPLRRRGRLQHSGEDHWGQEIARRRISFSWKRQDLTIHIGESLLLA